MRAPVAGAALHWQAARAQPGLAQDLTPALALPLAVVLGELGPYWLHRAAHRLPGLLLGFSAELHRWHHSVRAAEAHNFGTALPLWDQLFGSYVYRPGQAPGRVGWLEDAERPRRAPWLGCCLLSRP
ncbi:sterol desaturase family protein [Paucibacter soli]|uniref:sterol desaturase family protein n=1 Tax=Paucibacter soli TaxID=3133433 RepID=UPI0030981EED